MIKHYCGKEQKVYYEKMDNGLDIYIVPNKNTNRFHIELVCKYGSDISKFIPLGEKEFIKIPDGSAHYLEHKKFDLKDEDGIEYLSELGVQANAGTNYYFTRYYIIGQKKLDKAFDYLTTMVYTPYFTEDAIKKELGIISEEIKMYEDDPSWELDYAHKNSLFYYMMNKKIAGTEESIKEIHVDTLNKIFDTFYQPSNMFLIATGKVSKKRIIDILNNNKALNSKKANYPIIYEKNIEPKNVLRESNIIHSEIIVPKLMYSFKFSLDSFKMQDKSLLRLYLNAIFSILLGDVSVFSQRILENKISSSFYFNSFCLDGIYVIDIEAESDYADLFKEEVDNALSNINIKEEDFIRIKKVWISYLIRSVDNIDFVCENILDDIIKTGTYEDEFDLINKLNYYDLCDVIKELDLSNKTFTLMLPKESS